MTTPRLPALLAACLLASLVLAGCADDDAPTAATGLGGKTEQVIVDDPGETAGGTGQSVGGTAEAAPGNGEIRGVVQDDAGLPVAEALVSLLGTEFSETTDDQGGFRFANVSAGERTLRVNPPGGIFRVHEGQVDVVAGRITLVTITLVPTDGRGPGYRPHLHDHWGDATELLLMDAPIDWMHSPSCGGTDYNKYGPAGEVMTGVYQPNNAAWTVCFGFPDTLQDGRPPIVLPGTAQVRVGVSWGNDVDVDRFLLGYHGNDMKPAEFKDLPALASGEETTFDIAPEAADNGHQAFSLWEFRMRPEARSTPMTILGPINVKVTLLRGPLPVDPPHEDFWGGNQTYLGRSWDQTTTGVTVCCTDFHFRFALDNDRVVPPGTKELRIRFGYQLTQASGTPLDGDWNLYGKPANLPPGAGLDAYRLLTPAKTSANLKEYVVPVPPGETDAFYQTDSNWRFLVRPVQDLPEAFQETQHTLRLEVIAVKDPAFT